MSDDTDEMFFHFPPVPTEQPKRFGPPRSPEQQRRIQSRPQQRPLTDAEVDSLPTAELISRILDAEPYSLIFGAEPHETVSPNALKERFKNLSLRVHPDKTRAPRATEAFDRVKTAFGQIRDRQLKRN